MTRDEDLAPYLRLLVERGAAAATPVDASVVAVADWVADACREGCPDWGRCLMCPPYSPTPDEMRETLSTYGRCVLVRFSCVGYENRPPTREIVAEAEHAMRAGGLDRARAYAMGFCDLCDECNLDECVLPDVARPAMEACGIDVTATVEGAGLPMRWAENASGAMDLYCLILVD